MLTQKKAWAFFFVQKKEKFLKKSRKFKQFFSINFYV